MKSSADNSVDPLYQTNFINVPDIIDNRLDEISGF